MEVSFDSLDLIECEHVIAIIESIHGSGVTAEPLQEQLLVPEIETQAISDMILDKNRVPWDGDYHSATKTMTVKGFWKRGKGVSIEEYNDYASSQVVSMAPVTVPKSTEPAQMAPVPSPIAPVPVPVPVPVPAPNMLIEIDDIFGSLEESGIIPNFDAWVSSMIDWAKTGAKSISDLKDDMMAQEKLFNQLKSVQ